MIGPAEEAIEQPKASDYPGDHELLADYEQQHADATALLKRLK